jgi:hypothetical protein
MRFVIPGVDFHVDGQAASTLKSQPEATVSPAFESGNAFDMQAREIGWLVINEGQFYHAQISNEVHFYIQKSVEGTWEAWREIFRKRASTASWIKIIAKDVPFSVALQKATYAAKRMKP